MIKTFLTITLTGLLLIGCGEQKNKRRSREKVRSKTTQQTNATSVDENWFWMQNVVMAKAKEKQLKLIMMMNWKVIVTMNWKVLHGKGKCGSRRSLIRSRSDQAQTE